MRVKELLSHVPVPSKILRYFEGYPDLNYRNKEYATNSISGIITDLAPTNYALNTLTVST